MCVFVFLFVCMCLCMCVCVCVVLVSVSGTRAYTVAAKADCEMRPREIGICSKVHRELTPDQRKTVSYKIIQCQT